MTETTRAKHQALLADLRGLGAAAVAFSGGVDSTYLLAVTHEALGGKALAIIARSPSFPEREHAEALAFVEARGIPFRVVETRELDLPAYRENAPDRCFHCKTQLFETAWSVAREAGCEQLFEGSNADDTGDFRPGMNACRGLGVRSPLLEHGLSKDEIRELSREMGLPTWEKPAMACLASRVPYGQEINAERLGRIERAEQALRGLGLRQLRVRDHDDLARIEVEQGDLADLAAPGRREEIVAALRGAGYAFVCLDLEGYRRGSLNSVLAEDEMDAARSGGRRGGDPR